MNKFKVLRILYPGLIAVKPLTNIDFVEPDDKFSFIVSRVSKGLVIHDPFNYIVFGENLLAIGSDISVPREPNYMLTPLSDNMEIEFSVITEVNPAQARTYAEQPYTELFLILTKYDLSITIEVIRDYLLKLFVRYNSSVLHSTLLRPDESHWEESIVVLECVTEQKDSFEKLIANGFDLNLQFKPVLVHLGFSRYGILPKKADYLSKKESLLKIPSEFSDVFDLFASGVMQMNYYKNYKIAILECFVAVEVLVVRVTNEVQRKKGISNTKISEFKQAIDLAYRMDVLLKLFFSFDKKQEEVIGQMIRARKVRNDIMHNNKVVDKEEIVVIIGHIRTFLFLLINKFKKDYKETL